MVTLEELIKAFRKHEEEEIAKGLEIRDTSTHRTEISDLTTFNHALIFVHNELDQDLTVQLKGNWTRTYEDAVNIGSSITVSAGESNAVGISVTAGSWFPFVFAELSCSTAPSKGSVWVKVLKKPI